MLTATGTTIRTKHGLVDLIAIERFVAGTHPVALDPIAERPVAVWAAWAAGLSKNQIAERLRCRSSVVKDILDGPIPTYRGRPLVELPVVAA